MTQITEELNDIERLKTVVSNGRGFAEYHLWDDGNPTLADGTQENREGYFVSLVGDSDHIKICTGDTESVFGVIASEDAVAVVGGKLPSDSDGSDADMSQYGLVCVLGSAKVRRMSNVEVGDYVIPNALGMAQKQTATERTEIPYHEIIEVADSENYSFTHMPIDASLKVYVLNNDDTLGARVSIGKEAIGQRIAVNGALVTVVLDESGYTKGDRFMAVYNYKAESNLGYKVTSVSYESGVYYAAINLVPDGNALAHCKDEINSIYDRVSAVESNVIVALNRANAAYDLAAQGGGSGSGGGYDDSEGGNGGSVSGGGDGGNTTEITERLNKLEETVEETREIVNSTSTSIDTVVNDVNEVKEKFEPFDTWDDGQGNCGASYFVECMNEENIKTRTAIESMEGKMGQFDTAIIQNAKSLQSVANVVRKYSIGRYSQAYGLTFQEALDVLPNEAVYVPYSKDSDDITETYIVENGESKVVTFSEGFTYRWTNDGWVQETEEENVMFSGTYVQGSDGMPYWFLTSNNDIVHADVIYPKETLYAWNGFNWVAITALAENSTARATSLINQKANSVSVSVKDLNNNVAAMQTQIDDNTARIDLIAASQGDAEALAAIQMKSNQNAAEIDYLVAYGYEIKEYTEINEPPASGKFYADKPKWDNETGKWIFAGNAVSFDMATNEYRYAENTSDATTYYEYKCLVENKWRKLLIGRAQSIANIQQQADDNGASIGMLVTNGQVNAEVIVEAINDKSTVQITADKINFEGLATFVRPEDLQEGGKTVIDGDRITTGMIKSVEYLRPDDYKEVFSKHGTAFDLLDGAIRSEKFAIDDGNAYFAGEININDNFIVDKDGNVTLNGNITWGTDNAPSKTIYFYYLSTMEVTLSAPTYDGELLSPEGWTETPSGVDAYYPYEYVSQCTVQDGEYICSTPVLWAKYGRDGSTTGIDDDTLFNMLTEDGNQVGIFVSDFDNNGKKKLFLNADYIRTGSLTFGDGSYYIKPGVKSGEYLKLPGLSISDGGTSLSFGEYGSSLFISTDGSASFKDIYVGMTSISSEGIHGKKLTSGGDIQFDDGKTRSLIEALQCITNRLDALETKVYGRTISTGIGHGDDYYVNGECEYCYTPKSGATECEHNSVLSYDSIEHWFVCDKCGKLTGPYEAHRFVDGKCDICEYECTHDSVEWVVVADDDAYHIGKCSKCGVEVYEKELHSFSETGVCVSCGHMQGTTVCSHTNLSHQEYVAPTCATDGVEEYWYCSECETYFKDEGCTESWNQWPMISKTGEHIAQNTNAFVSETGSREHWQICKNCGEKFNFGEHDMIDDMMGTGTYYCGICAHSVNSNGETM